MNRQFLDISSGHLSPETWEWLDSQTEEASLRSPARQPEILAARTRYGWFVYADEAPPPPVPADLSGIMLLARKRGCEYILFDCDAAPMEDELPVLHPDFREDTGS